VFGEADDSLGGAVDGGHEEVVMRFLLRARRDEVR
jgi:hypothetical protein